jgi:hypothetical protein
MCWLRSNELAAGSKKTIPSSFLQLSYWAVKTGTGPNLKWLRVMLRLKSKELYDGQKSTNSTWNERVKNTQVITTVSTADYVVVLFWLLGLKLFHVFVGRA